MPMLVVTRNSWPAIIRGCRTDIEDAIGDDSRVFGSFHAGQKETELVTADPRDGIAFANGLGELVGDFLEELVAGTMANSVVDDLEAIEVEAHYRDLLPATARLRQLDTEPLFEQRAVRQPGEDIVVGEMADGFLRLLAFANVADEGAEADGVVSVEWDDRKLDRELDALAIERSDLDALVEDPPFAGGQEVLKSPPYVLPCAGAVRWSRRDPARRSHQMSSRRLSRPAGSSS